MLKLRELMEQTGLGHLTDDLLALAVNSIRLEPQRVDEANLTLGASKLGGLPDLPSSQAWPAAMLQDEALGLVKFPADGGPSAEGSVALSFIAQINMSEVAAYDSGHLLPASGLLYFFYLGAFYGRADDTASWRVLYYDGDLAQLQRTLPPTNLPLHNRFNPCAVGFRSQLMLPDANSRHFDGFSWLGLTIPHTTMSEAEMKAYEAMLYQLFIARSASGKEVSTHLLGYPEQIQDEVTTEAQISSKDISYQQLKSYAAADKLQTAHEISEWRLLLQVDCEDEAGMMWGDLGRLYFCIQERDLAARNFAAVWLVFQS